MQINHGDSALECSRFRGCVGPDQRTEAGPAVQT